MHRTGPIRSRLACALSAVLVGSTLAVTGVSGAAGAATATTAPKASAGGWDPRIAPIAREVAKLRDLAFEHPVPVRFLSKAAFEKQQRSKPSSLTKAQKAELARSQAQLRALGLIGQDVDLFKAGNDISATDVAAYYDPETKRITVNGDGALDAAKKVTLAHELTHALQDQHFDLQELERNAARDHAEAPLRAIVEGDAVRIQNLYQQQLPAADQKAAEAQMQADGASARASASQQQVPQMLLALFEAPYDFGPSLLQVAASTPGGVDGLFRKPPTNDSAYLTPSTVVDHARFRTVATPKVAKGEHEVGTPDVFGAFALYLVLASRLGPQAALPVADGWGGDSMISLRRDGHDCVRARFVGRDAASTNAIGDALQQWAAPLSADAATVDTADGSVTLTACDTGNAVPAVAHDGDEVLAFAAARDQLYGTLLQQHAPSKIAQCSADGIVRDPSFAPVLANPDQEPSNDQLATLRQHVATIETRCATS